MHLLSSLRRKLYGPRLHFVRLFYAGVMHRSSRRRLSRLPLGTEDLKIIV